MYRGSRPRILPIIIIIIVVALVVAALVTAGKMLFGSTKTSTADQSNSGAAFKKAVLDRTDTRSVRWTVRGPIVANEEFRSYQITISPNDRSYVVYSGYLDKVISSKSYANNSSAYEQFVYALDKASIDKTRSANDEDFRGVCATGGLAYQFETLTTGSVDQSEWSTTCKSSPGTMTADPLQVQALFVNQIPDFQPLFNSIY